MSEIYRPQEGIIELAGTVFKLKERVTSNQFTPLKKMREEHDNLERSGEVANLSEEDVNKRTDEWFEAVIKTGLQDNWTLAKVRDILTEGEIRTLVALTYNFLWIHGSISEAKRFYDTTLKIQQPDEK